MSAILPYSTGQSEAMEQAGSEGFVQNLALPNAGLLHKTVTASRSQNQL
jgi:hypothetical protein